MGISIREIIGRIKSKSGRDVICTFGGQIVIMLIMLVINKVISTFMTVEDFGQYNLIRRNASVLSFSMLGGAGISLPRYLALNKANDEERFAYLKVIFFYMLIVSGTVILFCLCFAHRLAPVLVGDTVFFHYLILIAYSFASSISAFILAYYRGVDDFLKYNGIQVSVQLLLLVPLFFVLRLTVLSLFLIWTLIILCVYLGFVAVEKNKQVKSIQLFQTGLKPYFREVTLYSLPRLAGDFLLFFISAFPLMYLNVRSSLSDVSFFSVGVSLLTMATPVFSVLGVILLPYVSSCLADGRMNDAKKNVNKLTLIYIFVAISLTLIGYFLMPLLIRLFFDSKYLETVEISRLILLALVPEALYLLYRNPIDAVSTFPYNTITVFISLLVLVFSFFCATSLREFATAYLAVAWLKGVISTIIWFVLASRMDEKKRI